MKTTIIRQGSANGNAHKIEAEEGSIQFENDKLTVLKKVEISHEEHSAKTIPAFKKPLKVFHQKEWDYVAERARNVED